MAMDKNPLGAEMDLGAEMETVFRRFDADGDGKLSKEELHAFLQSIPGSSGPSVNDEVEAMMRVADIDGDGFISMEEFVAVNITKDMNADIREAFKVYDRNGNGSISVEDLLDVMLSVGFEVSVEQCKKMVERVDQNGDGVINFDEFRAMMKGGSSSASKP